MRSVLILKSSASLVVVMTILASRTVTGSRSPVKGRVTVYLALDYEIISKCSITPEVSFLTPKKPLSLL